ncbi:MAG: hypothetical protein Q9201_002306 [Fulgogasparrea decipioides]
MFRYRYISKPQNRIITLTLAPGLLQHVTAMPYHLLGQTQQAKGNLFRRSPTEDGPAQTTRNRIRRGTVEARLAGILPKPSRHLSPRVPPPHVTHPVKDRPAVPTWLITALAIFIAIAIFWAIYLLYTRFQRIMFASPSSPPLSNNNNINNNNKNHRKKDFNLESVLTLDDHHDRRNSTVLGTPSRSFGLNKRRKPPPPSLDLEALKPRREARRTNWWDALPSIVPGRGNAFTPSWSTNLRADASSGSASGSAYSAGAGARLIARMVPEGVGSAVADSAWSSGSSLVERILGDGEGVVLPVTEEREDRVGDLERYFGDGRVGIRRDRVGDEELGGRGWRSASG